MNPTHICKHCGKRIPREDYHVSGWHRAFFCKKPDCQEAREQRKKGKRKAYNALMRQRRREAAAKRPERKVGRPRGVPQDEAEFPKYNGYTCDNCGAAIEMEYTLTGEPIIYRRLCKTCRTRENAVMSGINTDHDFLYYPDLNAADLVAIEAP